ncbi:MAG: GntR family transcriptional regulator [Burkholderiales bacterium]|nr:GntR family transcriptional regulator [Burkholderiales bacterium]
MNPRSLTPVQRPRALADQVYQALREQLRAGAIGAGSALQEVQLATQLGVSRTPVREALARLASEGLLATHGRSFTVPSLTLADVEDIYELRFLIEPAAARRVAPRTVDRRTRAPIDTALADAAAAHDRGELAAFHEANVRYRAAWLALVPNARLVRMIELYADHMQHIRALTLGQPRVRTIVLHGLQRITAALASGDADAAADAVHAHLKNARKAFVEALGLDVAPAARLPGIEAAPDSMPSAPRAPRRTPPRMSMKESNA